jgi:hypothetical protein
MPPYIEAEGSVVGVGVGDRDDVCPLKEIS